MSSQIEIIASNPVVKEFTLKMISVVRKKKLFEYKQKIIVDADMVPKVPVGRESIKTEKPVLIRTIPKIKPIVKNPQGVPSIFGNEVQSPVVQKKNLPPKIEKPKMITQKINKGVSNPMNFAGEYGGITILIKDPAIYSIECAGAGRPINVFKGGQKQVTKIVLSEGEIKMILQNISNKLHIPLLDGVFRASVDNFAINAIVSNIVGSKFVIKKTDAAMFGGRI